MTTSSSFEAGRLLGGNISKGLGGITERNTIEKVLQAAQNAESPNDIDVLMGGITQRVSPERQQEPLQMLQKRKNDMLMKQEQGARTQLGQNPALSQIQNPQERIAMIRAESAEKQKQIMADSKSAIAAEKQTEKMVGLQKGEQVIKRIDELINAGNLGQFMSFVPGQTRKGWLPSAEREKDQAEYSKLSDSLIGMTSNISIRNQREFDRLARGLGDPTLGLSKIKGTVDALKRIMGEELKIRQEKLSKVQGQNQQQPQINEQQLNAIVDEILIP